MSDTGIVIVTHNSQEHIGPCLDAALLTGADTVVVDNGSHDGTIAVAARRGVHLIANPTNRGFAAAVNQGFAVLNSAYVLLLNPDAVLQGGLDALREASSLPGSAGAGGCLVDVNGRPQIGFMVRQLPSAFTLILEVLLLNKIWPNNPINRRYRGLRLDYSARMRVEQPAGAFLMIRRPVWEELGGFDEGFYPIWFEDVDFCKRAADRGHRFYFAPLAVAKHTGGHSISELSLEKRVICWYGSLLRYSAKHFGPIACRVLCLAVVVGSLLRSVGESALRWSLAPLAAYGKVVRQASRCFLFGWGTERFGPAPNDLG
ncbi:MAG TPA: glycosyltransferase family 2 protein [Bryobacteraceae bacterium]|nr:glycosyltransferase family 2 protein [Bryobacteraceae bacterium]